MFHRTRRLFKITKESARLATVGAMLGGLYEGMGKETRQDIARVLPLYLESTPELREHLRMIVAQFPGFVRIFAELLPENDVVGCGPRCGDCDEAWGHGYMVTDEVWEAANERDGDDDKPEVDFLCLPCLQKRLDRHLMITDFPERPINASIRWAIRNVVEDDTH